MVNNTSTQASRKLPTGPRVPTTSKRHSTAVRNLKRNPLLGVKPEAQIVADCGYAARICCLAETAEECRLPCCPACGWGDPVV
jgi:hypothetical protein